MLVAIAPQLRVFKDKGKQKAILDEEGDGGSSGIVLPLQMILSSSYQAYVLRLYITLNHTTFISLF